MKADGCSALLRALVLSAAGKLWTSPEKTDLPNNNAAIQAIVLSNGKVIICYNPTNKPRDIMRISLSEDGGETWPHYKVTQMSVLPILPQLLLRLKIYIIDHPSNKWGICSLYSYALFFSFLHVPNLRFECGIVVTCVHKLFLLLW